MTEAPSLPDFLQRWHLFLSVASDAYRELKEEQAKGWASPALDALYQHRAPLDSNCNTNAPATSGSTVFNAAAVDVEKLADRYCQHASKILPKGNRELFAQSGGTVRNKTAPELPHSFVDLGCAPGGVSIFLNRRCRWNGVGVSLSEDAGGIAMTKQLLCPSATSSYAFLPKSILDSDLVECVREKAMTCGAFASQDGSGAGATYRFDFVNGGAVQDHGQRSGLSDSDPGADAPALPWFTFLVPQLLASFRLVKTGGSVMVVYGMSTCGGLFLLLHLLVHELRLVPSFEDVQFLETMHHTKPPIYVMLNRVQPTDERIAALERFFARGRCTDDTGHGIGGAADSNAITCSRCASSFWKLDEPTEMAHAQAAFRSSCRRSLEAVWAETTAFLRARREKAEKRWTTSSKLPDSREPSKRERAE